MSLKRVLSTGFLQKGQTLNNFSRLHLGKKNRWKSNKFYTMAGEHLDLKKFMVCCLLSPVYLPIDSLCSDCLFVVQNSSKLDRGFAPWRGVKSRGTGALADWFRAPEI